MKYKNLVDIHTHFEASIPNISLARLLIKNNNSLVKKEMDTQFTFPYQKETAHLVIEALNKNSSAEEVADLLEERFVLKKPAESLLEFIFHLPTVFLRWGIRTKEDLYQLLSDSVDSYRENYKYIEILFCPKSISNSFISEEDVVNVFADFWKNENCEGFCNFVISLVRNKEDVEISYVEKISNQYSKFIDKGFGKIDICGDECALPLSDLDKQIDKLINSGWQITPHAGETGDVDLEYILENRPQILQINHGIRVLNNPKLLDIAQKREVVFTYCPVSNIYTKAQTKEEVIKTYKKFVELNMNFILCADDPAIIPGGKFAPYDFEREIGK